MKPFVSNSLEETQNIAAKWLASISTKYNKMDEALVVGLSGHLGAGKTAFVKALAKELGIAENVTSPTFVIMKMYEIDHSKESMTHVKFTEDSVIPWNRFVHIDAYRLERRQELDALDWEKLVSDKNNLIIIEWPENVELKDFARDTFLKFEIVDGKHNITVS